MLVLREGSPRLLRQRRSRLKADRLRQAARDVFGRRGFEQATVGDICGEARIAVGAFYIYFTSKRQLLVDLMNGLLGHLSRLEVIPASASVVTKQHFRRYVIAALETDRANLGVIRAWREAVGTDPELASLNRRIETWTANRVEALLRLLQRCSPSPRPAEVKAFAVVVDRHLWELLGRSATLPRRDFVQQARITSDFIYHYLARDSRRP